MGYKESKVRRHQKGIFNSFGLALFDQIRGYYEVLFDLLETNKEGYPHNLCFGEHISGERTAIGRVKPMQTENTFGTT